MDEWAARSLRLTVVCLVTSALLILPAVAGVGPSLPVAGLLAAVAAGCYAVRDRLASLPTLIGYDLGRYGPDLPFAALLGSLVVAAGPAGTPAELQALGGLVGLAGMVNYFVRPLYLALFSLARRLVSRA